MPAGGAHGGEGYDEVLMREYEAEERQMDRDWYDADEFGATGPEQVRPGSTLRPGFRVTAGVYKLWGCACFWQLHEEIQRRKWQFD